MEPLVMNEWQPIETAPRSTKAIFWIRQVTVEDDHFVDTDGNPILSEGDPQLFIGKRGTWSSLMKATHWMPLPLPPSSASPPR